MEGSLADQLAAKLQQEEQVDSPTTTLGRIGEIVEKATGVESEQVTGGKSPSDLGVDSLSMIEITVRCEEAFGVRLDDATVLGFSTVGEFADYLDEHAAAEA